MVKKTTAFIIMALILSTASCSGKKETRYEAEFLELFDTVTQIVAYTQSEEEFEGHSQLIYDKLSEYHRLYDIYNDYEGINNIKTINDNAGISPVSVDKRIIDLILFAKEEYKNSDGKMNIAFGSVLKIWHDYRIRGIENPENAELPPMDKLKAAAEHTDINNVIVDENECTVFLSDPDMSLDVGAIGKGFAVEQVSKIAMENGFNSGLISVGGNIRTIGNKAGKHWNVGVRNPDNDNQNNLHVVYLSDLSLVTSGSYERYYTVGGKRYHHIIDPKTLFPSEYFTSVTIICRDAGMADALSTAIFNMPFEQGLALIDNLPNTEALWVLNNGEIKYSANFKDFIKE